MRFKTALGAWMVLFLLLSTGCVSITQAEAVPSGPTIRIPVSNASKARTILTQLLQQHGYVIDTATDTLIAAQKPMDAEHIAEYNRLYAVAPAKNYQWRLAFQFSTANTAIVTITAKAAALTENSVGKTESIDMTLDNNALRLSALLNALKQFSNT